MTDEIIKVAEAELPVNEELIIQRGYVPIFDCGQDTYIWKR